MGIVVHNIRSEKNGSSKICEDGVDEHEDCASPRRHGTLEEILKVFPVEFLKKSR